MTLFLLMIFIALASVAAASLSLIVWVPTRKKDLSRILALASLQEGERFIDLGCGSGTVSHYMASRTNGEVHGIELALPFYLWCLLRRFFSREKNLHYVWGSLFALDLSRFDVIYVFGIPDKLKDRLKPKFERELRPGSRVISYAFPIDGWKPAQISKPDNRSVSINLYIR